ncbi:DUF6603 domain-containing protein [Cryptosporangium minutisporangium]|uniref:DUF6603 domain-containing protein n=1 Tax=Cryptosporangium minutisporangium TaxID=113569 RepID=A0ABP6SY88_9ACTN
MTADALGALLRELERLVQPLDDAVESEEARRLLLISLGWDLDAVDGYPIPELLTGLGQIGGALRALTTRGEPTGLSDVVATLGDLGEAASGLQRLAELADQVSALGAGEVAAALGHLGAELGELVVFVYLARYRPTALQVARLLTLAVTPDDVPLDERTEVLVDDASGLVRRYPVARPRLRLDRLPDLVRDPAGLLKAEYPLHDMADDAAARELAAHLFGRLGPLLAGLGVDVTVGAPLDPGDGATPAAASLVARSLILRFPADAPADASALELTLALVPASDGGPAVTAALAGTVAFTWEGGAWRVGISVTGTVTGFGVGPNGVTLPDGVEDADVRATVTAERVGVDPNAPALRIGGAEGTRLELGRIGLRADVGLTSEHQEYGLALEIGTAAMVIAAGDGDGFLQKILPAEGIRAPFDLALGWSNTRGLHFRAGTPSGGGGAPGLSTTIDVPLDLGFLKIPSVYLAVEPTDGEVAATVALNVEAKLGPFSASAERLGLRLVLTFPEDGGNLGPVDLAVEFQPPIGVGLAIDSSVVTGGGYLFIDRVNRQYAGALELQFAGIALKAVGLLATRMPDGSDGFSLFVLISAEFTPIQLGFGFTLSGVGGFLGVNRRIAIDAIRDGLRTGGLDSVLFPQNLAANARRVVSDLGRFFPIAPGQFLLGPMVKLNWGSPPLITAVLGVMVELPNPVRVVLLGRLTMALPKPESPVVDLKIDVLGTLDFAARELAIDAVLRDSRIAAFTVAGEMAIRVNFGARPELIIAVGGFNPRFAPPAGFPRLRRMTIALASGDNPRLRLETYLALTPNTAQMGARLDLFVGVGPFSIEANFGFDALLQFVPFAFLVDVHAGVALKWGGSPLFAIRLEGTLSGPAPTRIVGAATFDFFGSHTIQVDHTFGLPEPPVPPEVVDVGDRLRKALGDRTNWRGQLPPDGTTMVSLRAGDPDTDDPDTDEPLLLHPLGTIAVQQRVVPLELEITRYGSAQLAGEERFFAIGAVRVGSESPKLATVREPVALGQYQDLSDPLTAPSFQQLPVGKRVEPARYGLPPTGSGALTIDLGYEDRVYDRASPDSDDLVVASRSTRDLTDERATGLAAGGAAGRTELRRLGGRPLDVSLQESAWVVAVTGERVPATPFTAEFDSGVGYGQAAGLLRRLRIEQPGLARGLRLTPAHEVTP